MGNTIDWAAIPNTAVKVLTSPAEFFRGMPKTGGVAEPLVFLIAMAVAAGILQAVFGLLGFRIAAGFGMGLGSLVVTPILAAAFSFVGAAVLFVIWKLMGSGESYETAYRCGAYMGALAPVTVLLGVIPYIGAAAGLLLMTSFLVTASVEVHNLPSRKAWIVFGIIGGLFLLMNLSAQMAARRMQNSAEEFQKMSEEAAKQMGRHSEEMAKELEKARKAMERMKEDGSR
ncbi:MAG: YIP1 family protein [Deltaproteobacteria bacterium]|nr:YIP1 family protein [Deltaproteobacteria bacterium]